MLSAYTGTFVAETIRSGINSVSRGQAEAARAIGLTFPQTLRLVVMPQALRTVVGPLGGIFIALLKNSGLAVVINVPELTAAANQIGTDTARFIPAFLGAAVAYLMLTVPVGLRGDMDRATGGDQAMSGPGGRSRRHPPTDREVGR